MTVHTAALEAAPTIEGEDFSRVAFTQEAEIGRAHV